MPDQATMQAATPKCHTRSMRDGQWTDCHQPLRWNDPAERWECPTHKAVLSSQHAVDRLELAARTTSSGP
jgi:hypothetical protein